uniref:Uncharacterized protein n=1 Tax=Parascaris equorum TaxID=6256 RepID=A0A914RJ55_PAREQ
MSLFRIQKIPHRSPYSRLKRSVVLVVAKKRRNYWRIKSNKALRHGHRRRIQQLQPILIRLFLLHVS